MNYGHNSNHSYKANFFSASDFNTLLHKKNKKLAAFTLAEVLITLGILGVVMAITIPTMINNYNKKITAKKVAKFYSLMSNAIGLVNSDEGNDLWIGNYPYKEDKDIREFYDKYLNDKIIATQKLDLSGKYLIGLPDGSAFIPWFGGLGEKVVFFTYCTTFAHCKTHREQGYDGISGFLFIYDKTRKFTTYCQPTTPRTTLLNKCEQKAANDHNKSHCCSALLMRDNWEIKSDYPW